MDNVTKARENSKLGAVKTKYGGREHAKFKRSVSLPDLTLLLPPNRSDLSEIDQTQDT